MATQTKDKRDITLALGLLRKIKESGLSYTAGVADRELEVNQLEQLLIDLDARTGRKDPTKRKPAKKAKPRR